jgi:pilus assembly protein CpaD
MSTNQALLFPSARQKDLLRLAGIAAMIAATALVSSCGTTRPDHTTTGAIPDDYRRNHPITLAEAEHDLDVPLAAGEHGLTPSTRDLIKGFAQDYAALSKGTIRIALPLNAANSPTAQRLRGQIRQVLIDNAVPASRIVFTNYDAPAGNVSAPVRLGFVAVTAMTNECGQWPSDLMTGPSVIENRNYENFGCASQQNLAAQIANPNDLVGPRGMSPIDAQNRAAVIDAYRSDATSTDSSSSSSSSSTSGQ